MPYVSKAQERFFHTKEGMKKVGGSKVVEEFDEASKGVTLPERSNSKKKKPAPLREADFRAREKRNGKRTR